MNQAHIYRIGTGIVLCIIIFGGVFFFYRRAGEQETTTATGTPQSQLATTSQPLIGTHTQGGVTGTGKFTVNVIPAVKSPDFNAPIAFGAGVSADVRTAIESSFQSLKSIHAKNAADLKAWLDLGTLRKMAGDYAGAEADWRFVAQVSLRNTAAFWNLGDLYANFLKEYPKAEEAYQKVIALDAKSVGAYRSLYELYLNSYKTSTTAAEDILKQGITANPDAVELRILLARYYKQHDRAGDAKAQYDAAIASAERQNNVGLVAQLKTEAGE